MAEQDPSVIPSIHAQAGHLCLEYGVDMQAQLGLPVPFSSVLKVVQLSILPLHLISSAVDPRNVLTLVATMW